jgi:SLOG in TRPM, prokaryote
MSSPFQLLFSSGGRALAVRADRTADLPTALTALGLGGPRPAVVLVGGADGLDRAEQDRLYPLVARGIAPVAEDHGAVVIDGGTDAGIMRLIGQVRDDLRARFPLIGVAAAGTVVLPGAEPERPDAAPLEPRHTHFVLVPGNDWGAEAPWISRVATALADGMPTATVLINGGEIAFADVAESLDQARPVIAVPGTGRTADRLALAVRGGAADEGVMGLVASGLITAAGSPERPDILGRALAGLLGRAPDPASG